MGRTELVNLRPGFKPTELLARARRRIRSGLSRPTKRRVERWFIRASCETAVET
jgi:hypothetical protein